MISQQKTKVRKNIWKVCWKMNSKGITWKLTKKNRGNTDKDENMKKGEMLRSLELSYAAFSNIKNFWLIKIVVLLSNTCVVLHSSSSEKVPSSCTRSFLLIVWNAVDIYIPMMCTFTPWYFCAFTATNLWTHIISSIYLLSLCAACDADR